MYLYSLMLLIAPKRQLDTVKWGDKQILVLLIGGDGKNYDQQAEGVRVRMREENPDTNTSGQDQDVMAGETGRYPYCFPMVFYKK